VRAAGRRGRRPDDPRPPRGRARHREQRGAPAGARAGRGPALGQPITGNGVQELLHAATIAVAARVPLEELWHAVPAFPTVSEVWLHALEAAGF
jgi:pyruvate/2-oxoglutarate dehydrogenase complex dihydrolipoamide dehydrogenase (E3) component